MSLMVAAELKRRGSSLQQIRKIVGHLRRLGFERPLTEVRFATVKDEVYFQLADGSWQGHDVPDQIVLHQVMDLEPLRARIRSAGERRKETVGHIERRRGAMGSKPVVAGTRVPVATVARYLARGRSVNQILQAFPVLHRRDVEAVRRELTVA